MRKVAAAVARFLTVHKADGGKDERADVPGGSPALLMVVGKTGADGDISFEPSGGSVEDEFGGGEGVVFVELEEAEVVAFGV